MKHESGPRSEKTDDQIFEDIGTLTEKEGWHFHGNMFQTDQTYQLVLSKEGEKDKVFCTRKPYHDSGRIVGKQEVNQGWTSTLSGKDADPDIPILKQAKAEYAKLQ
jgi:hypothetical protein